MTIIHLLAALYCLGLCLGWLSLGKDGKSRTGLLALALVAGVVQFGARTGLSLGPLQQWQGGILLAADLLYTLFFVLLAMHYTSRRLLVLGYWAPQGLICLAVLAAGLMAMLPDAIDAQSLAELRQMLLFLSGALVFGTVNKSEVLANEQPVFWIPTLLVAFGYAIAAAGKTLATLFHFADSPLASLLTAISSGLGLVATILVLLLLTLNILWFRDS